MNKSVSLDRKKAKAVNSVHVYPCFSLISGKVTLTFTTEIENLGMEKKRNTVSQISLYTTPEGIDCTENATT